jgi:hypothetical protein
LQPCRNPLAQVGRGLAREGEDEQLLRAGALFVDQPNGSFDYDARFPRSRPGEDDRRPVAVFDCRLLVRV